MKYNSYEIFLLEEHTPAGSTSKVSPVEPIQLLARKKPIRFVPAKQLQYFPHKLFPSDTSSMNWRAKYLSLVLVTVACAYWAGPSGCTVQYSVYNLLYYTILSNTYCILHGVRNLQYHNFESRTYCIIRGV